MLNTSVKKFKVNIPIVRRNYDKTNSSKFKGNLQIISNQHGIIYNWKIIFKTVHVDTYTTLSWFKNKKASFKRREKLFNQLGLKQEQRPQKSANKLVKLKNEQLKKLNDFLNDRKQYNSTIKNILPLLKGNNPGGEAENPQSAEMIIDSKKNVKNFVILLDDLVMTSKLDDDCVGMFAKEINFQEFFQINDTLKCAFNYMQKNKDLHSWLHYSSQIKEYYKKYNVDISLANAIASRARSQFGKNIDKMVEKLPFNFESKNQFQKCHIYKCHNLRDQILEAIRNNQSYQKFKKMISDINNFIPLPEEIHRKFDHNYFTYKLDGTIWAINEKGTEFINKYLANIFKKIPTFFLNDERKKYLEMRNGVLVKNSALKYNEIF